MSLPTPQISRRIMRRRLLSVAVAHALMGSMPAVAANIVVNDLSDTTGGSACTLRDAITSANNDTASGGCAAGQGVDYLDLTSLRGTITLTGGVINITTPIQLEGPGASNLTISGNNASQLFNVDNGNPYSSPLVGFNGGFTLTGGRAQGSTRGGAIRNAEILSIRESVITGNSAVGLPAQGGAIYNEYGRLSISYTTISDNVADGINDSGRGGAIASKGGSLIVFASTLSDNTAQTTGGAVFAEEGTVTIINSTISGNTADTSGGGLASVGATAELTHVTIANNTSPSGAGLYNSQGSISLINSVAGDNNGADCFSVNGTVSANGNASLIEDGGCSTNARSGDPGLGLLSDNGGPTRTHHPEIAFFGQQSNSVLLDAADGNSCISRDQRAIPRIDTDGLCDIGAVEAVTQVNVNTLDDVVNASDGQCSLREAVDRANNNSPMVVVGGECGAAFGSVFVSFDESILPGTITLGGTELAIEKPMQINGPGADRLTVSGGNLSRILNISDVNGNTSHEVRIDNITLADGFAPGGSSTGGAIRSLEDLTIRGVVLTGNTAAYGGAIAAGGTLSIIASTISGNSATKDGGGLSPAQQTTIRYSTISGNVADDDGGGINSSQRTVTISNSTIADNTAADLGAGLNVFLGQVTLSNTIIGGSSGPDCSQTSTQIIASDSSIIEDGGCATQAMAVDPLLGPLLGNGGSTRTHLPAPQSPALDSGDPCGGRDQRGMLRGRDVCDIGAVERSSTQMVVTTLDDTQADDGLCSLREAVVSVNERAASGINAGECPAGYDAPTISFDPAIHGGTVTLAGTSIQIGPPPTGEVRELTIQGPTASGMTIDANSQSQVIQSYYSTATLSHLTLTGADHPGRGGAIESFVSDITIRSSTLVGNNAQSGSAIIDDYGTTTLVNSTVSGNSSSLYGTIGARFSTLVITNSTIANNTVTNTNGTSGGVYVGSNGSTASATFTNTILANNVPVDCIRFDTNSSIGAAVQNIIADASNCGTNTLTVDPMLAALQDNGGATITHALLPGSPAIDSGDNTACVDLAVDQIGNIRSVDSMGGENPVCDLGSVEFGSMPPSDVLFQSGFEETD